MIHARQRLITVGHHSNARSLADWLHGGIRLRPGFPRHPLVLFLHPTPALLSSAFGGLVCFVSLFMLALLG